MKIPFAVASGRNDRIDEIPSLAQTAEEAGFSYLTFLDSQNLSRDIYCMMTLVAANTRRLHTGQTVTNPFTRHPSVTANATATVHELSGGRAYLGLGSGYSAVRTMGIKRRPLKELRSAIAFFRAYFNGELAEYNGVKVQSEWVKRPIKIMVAAEGPKALVQAGELADGVVFMGGLPFVIKWKLDKIYEGAEKAGRDPSELDIWVRSYIYVCDKKEEAHREVSTVLAPHGGLPHYAQDDPEIQALYKRAEKEQPGLLDEIERATTAVEEEKKKHPAGFDPWFEKIDAPWSHLVSQRMIDNVHLVGQPDEIAEGIRRYADVGVKTLATSVYTFIDKKGMITEIGRSIIPQFRN